MGVNYINRITNNSCDDAARTYVFGQGFWENLFSYGSISKQIKEFKRKNEIYIIFKLNSIFDIYNNTYCQNSKYNLKKRRRYINNDNRR